MKTRPLSGHDKVMLTSNCVKKISSACRSTPFPSLHLPLLPFLPLPFLIPFCPPSRPSFPPLPNKYRLSPHLTTSQGRANFKRRSIRHTNTAWQHNKSEIRRRATKFIHRTHSVISTYRRFFEAESVYLPICKRNKSCRSNSSPIRLPTSWMWALLPGKPELYWKQTAIICKNINSVRK